MGAATCSENRNSRNQSRLMQSLDQIFVNGKQWLLGFLPEALQPFASILLIIAAIFGFGGIAGTASGIAQILFVGFLILAVLSLLFGRRSPV